MCKEVLLGMLLTVSRCSLQAQQANEPSANLSADFAKAGLQAVKAIQRCTGTMFLDENRLVVPRETRKSVDSAGAAARTDTEKALVGVLNDLFLARLNTNMSRATIMMNGFSPESRERLKKEADADDAITASESKQRRCAAALIQIFQTRSYAAPPKDCKNVAF